MQALGLIETRGLIAAIESADAMLKAAEVKLLEKTLVGGGLVTIAVVGDVGAVKAAVEAGEAAIRQINETLLISKHVIPRPHPDMEGVIVGTIVQPIENTINEEETNETKSNDLQMETTSDDLHKETIDKLIQDTNIEEVIDVLSKLPVVKLRKLAREYKTFGIIGREISKADKELLIAKFAEYYQ